MQKPNKLYKKSKNKDIKRDKKTGTRFTYNNKNPCSFITKNALLPDSNLTQLGVFNTCKIFETP